MSSLQGVYKAFMRKFGKRFPGTCALMCDCGTAFPGVRSRSEANGGQGHGTRAPRDTKSPGADLMSASGPLIGSDGL